jgi:hypothetical protein
MSMRPWIPAFAGTTKLVTLINRQEMHEFVVPGEMYISTRDPGAIIQKCVITMSTCSPAAKTERST